MAVDTVTNILSDIYEAMDIVSREPVGLMQSVTLSSQADRASLNQNIDVPIEPAISGVTVSPSMTIPDPAALTPTTATVTMSNSKSYPFQLTGDTEKAYNTGVGWSNGRAGRIAQAIRALVNDVETTLAGLHTSFSRAYGTAGTTPFASTLADSAQIKKILDDNGAPAMERTLVIDTTAGANLRTLAQLTQVNTSGTDSTLRNGVLLPIHGIDVRESGQILTSTAGTGSSATTDNAGYSIGDTVITLAVAGTGTIVAGDVITFAGDTNKYVVASGDADVSNGGTITLAAPGLRKAIAASTTAITVVAAAARNMAFSRNAILLAARPVATPSDGDAAVDRMIVVDPVSGFPIEFAYYKGYHMNRWEASMAWGASVVKPEHTALLLG